MSPHINGKVIGFPTTVPIRAAIKLPLIKKAKTTAKIKCNPKRGVNETIEPQAKPDETAYADAGNLANLSL